MDQDEIKRLDQITAVIFSLLKGHLPPPIKVKEQPNDEIRQLAGYVNRLIEQEDALFQTTLNLSRGTLDEVISTTLPSAGSLKNLQASLRHLTWQTQQIASGDFSHRTNFLGEFSKSFNWMIEELEQYRQKMQEEIATRQEAQQTAEHASRAKSDFLANMSHELRTPLNHIIGFTQLVIDKHFGTLNEIQEQYLQDVLNSSHHLLSLVNDILDLSKVEAGKLKLKTKEVALPPLLENALLMVKEKAHKHGLKLRLIRGNIPQSAVIDELKFKQIVYNLLANAVKFTPKGGTITVKAGIVSRLLNNMRQNLLEICVIDSGIGLSQKEISTIFDPFEQGENPESQKREGTGLGLSITKRLVELHGGRIWAESEGKGKGSTFGFQIPQ